MVLKIPSSSDMTYFEQSYSFRCSFRTSLKPSLFKTITCLRQLLSGYETSLFPFLVQVQSKWKYLWEGSILGFSFLQYCSCPNQPGLLYWVLCFRGPSSGPPLGLLFPTEWQVLGFAHLQPSLPLLGQALRTQEIQNSLLLKSWACFQGLLWFLLLSVLLRADCIAQSVVERRLFVEFVFGAVDRG